MPWSWPAHRSDARMEVDRNCRATAHNTVMDFLLQAQGLGKLTFECGGLGPNLSRWTFAVQEIHGITTWESVFAWVLEVTLTEILALIGVPSKLHWTLHVSVNTPSPSTSGIDCRVWHRCHVAYTEQHWTPLDHSGRRRVREDRQYRTSQGKGQVSTIRLMSLWKMRIIRGTACRKRESGPSARIALPK